MWVLVILLIWTCMFLHASLLEYYITWGPCEIICGGPQVTDHTTITFGNIWISMIIRFPYVLMSLFKDSCLSNWDFLYWIREKKKFSQAWRVVLFYISSIAHWDYWTNRDTRVGNQWNHSSYIGWFKPSIFYFHDQCVILSFSNHE